MQPHASIPLQKMSIYLYEMNLTKTRAQMNKGASFVPI